MIRILSDSTSDLGAELIERYGISVLPLHVLLGEKDYRDGADISAQMIFDWANENRSVPKTAAPSVEEAKAILREGLEAGDELVCFTISSEMSASFSVLQLAAKQLRAEDRVSVVDSRNLSTGIAHLVIGACEDATAGMSRQEIVRRAMEDIPRVRASFVVDTLEYLHRGGRCSGLSAMMGSILHIHPRIAVADGKMHPDVKYRGHLEKVIMRYVKDMEEQLKKSRPRRVFITHSHVDADIVNKVREYILSLGHFEEVLETYAGGVITSHCGPGTLGVLYVE
ncbi:MAG: DegV family protein [Clostridia bacterium]|nr:DegV family protein [Clostridia bacterium]